jgi:hypothetical protein
MEHTIDYGKSTIKFNLIKTNRKTLAISVYPDMTVEVNAPDDKKEIDIYKRVKKRSTWIIKQINYFRSLPAPLIKRKFKSGETHKYLGKQYRLKIHKSENYKAETEIKIKDGYINIYILDKIDIQTIEKNFTEWYLEKARKLFTLYLKECLEKINRYNIPTPQIIIKEMKARWGSCNYNNKISLNINLIKLSPNCIKYVIMHELCHLKYYNHSKDFYKLLSGLMPDWKKRKEILEQSEL